jgi:hypothetical protein
MLKKLLAGCGLAMLLGALTSVGDASAKPPPPTGGGGGGGCEQCVNNDCKPTLNPGGGGADCTEDYQGNCVILNGNCTPQPQPGGGACGGFNCIP